MRKKTRINIPDDVQDGLDLLFPDSYRVESESNWYNVGGYNGTNGGFST